MAGGFTVPSRIISALLFITKTRSRTQGHVAGIRQRQQDPELSSTKAIFPLLQPRATKEAPSLFRGDRFGTEKVWAVFGLPVCSRLLPQSDSLDYFGVAMSLQFPLREP